MPDLRLLPIFLLLITQLPAQGSLAPRRPGDAVAGSVEGTERWLVHFAAPALDLEALRKELHGLRRPQVAAEMVSGLEARTKQRQAPFVRELTALGSRLLQSFWIVNACEIELRPDRLEDLRRLPGLSYVEPVVANGYHVIGTARNVNNHNTDAVTINGLTGRGGTIAILDSGQDEKCGSKGRPHVIYSERGATNKNRLIVNLALGSQPAEDSVGHGTQVAACAAGWIWPGLDGAYGAAPESRIVGYTLADQANGDVTSASRLKGWQQLLADAAKYDIRVANYSVIGSPDPMDAREQALDKAARIGDVLIVTAAGNTPSPTKSAICTNGISVGAVVPNTHELANFSARGTPDGQVFPDIVANGVSVSLPVQDDETLTQVSNGTSFATPFVAGIGLLLRAEYPELSALETRAILLASAKASPGTKSTQTPGVGVGYAKAEAAYLIAREPLRRGEARLDASNRVWNGCIRVQPGKTYRIAIAWFRDDESTRDWSNLDLELRDSQNLVLASSTTLRNTEEFVRYKATKNETLHIRVEAKFLRGTYQDFAWAVNTDVASESEPDLRTLSVSSSSQVLVPKQVYELRSLQVNSGCKSAGISSVGFYLSTDDQITTADTFLGNGPVKALGVLERDTGIHRFTMPTNINSGTYYLGAISDVLKNVQEGDETNNVGEPVRIEVAPETGLPDLRCYIGIVSQVRDRVVAGASVTCSINVSNSGDAPSGPCRLQLSLGNGRPTHPIAHVAVPALAAKGSFNIPSMEIYVPLCASRTLASCDNLYGMVDHHLAVAESDETNNLFTARTTKRCEIPSGRRSIEIWSPGVHVDDSPLRAVFSGQQRKIRLCVDGGGKPSSPTYILGFSFNGTGFRYDSATDLGLSLLSAGGVFKEGFGVFRSAAQPEVSLPGVKFGVPLSIWMYPILFGEEVLPPIELRFVPGS